MSMSKICKFDDPPQRNARFYGSKVSQFIQYEKTNKGYDNRKYNEIAAKIRKQCMLPDKLKMKFLRHSGATVLGENGATEDQISAVTGHKSRQMLNIYVKKTKRLASSAQQLRFK